MEDGNRGGGKIVQWELLFSWNCLSFYKAFLAVGLVFKQIFLIFPN